MVGATNLHHQMDRDPTDHDGENGCDTCVRPRRQQTDEKRPPHHMSDPRDQIPKFTGPALRAMMPMVLVKVWRW